MTIQPWHFALPILGLPFLLLWRRQETLRPVNAAKLLAPPLGMATGHLMFLYPPFRVPWTWALAAWSLGFFVLSWPLIASSRLVKNSDGIYLRHRPYFLAILLLLVGLRLLLRESLSGTLSPFQLSSLTFALAFGTIVHWRLHLWQQFRKLREVL